MAKDYDYEDLGVVDLIDEDGNVIQFKYVDITEYKGKKYVLLSPMDNDLGFDENDVVIVEYNDDKGEIYVVESDELAEEIFEFYTKEQEEEEDD